MDSASNQREILQQDCVNWPRTDLHSSRSTQERDPSSQKNCPIVRMLIILLPLASVWGNPLYIVNSNGWKRENHSQSGKPPVHCSTRSWYRAPSPSPCPVPRSGQHGVRARLSGPQVGAWRVADRFLQTADVEALQRCGTYGLELAKWLLCWTTRPAPRSGEGRGRITILLRRAHGLREGT